MWTITRAKRAALLAGGGAADKTRLYDTFTDANGTALTAHTIAPTNTPATTWAVGSGDTFDIQSNKARITAEGETDFAIAYVDSGLADCTIDADMTFGNTGKYAGLVFRVQDKNNLWELAIDALSGRLRILSRIAGTFTEVKNVAFTSANATKAYQIVLSGSSITVKADGTTITTHTSSTFATQTKHGIVGITEDASLRWDNFRVSVL